MAGGSTHTVKVNYKANVQQFVAGTNAAAIAIKNLRIVLDQRQPKPGSGNRQVQEFGKQIDQATRRVNQFGHAVINTFNNAFNSMRIISQGFMTFGRALTTALTPLAALTLFSASKAAIDFDAVMTKVAKTTGFTRKQLQEVSTGLRELAITTSTSTVELGGLAEQIGQIGVTSPQEVIKLTDLFNKLMVATGMSADTIAVNMGKIANAFGMDLNTDEGVDQLSRLSSVINELENQTEASAPEIVEGMLNLAEAGSLLKFDPVTASAMVSTLVSVGYSADEAGTAMRNFMIKATQEADKVAAVMQNIWGGDMEDAIRRLNEDAAGALLDLIAAASKGNSAAQTLFTTIEIGGIRGGKGWASLAAAVDDLRKNLGLANKEFETGTSLMLEYERALLSTKNQLGVLKNNLNEVALTLGDALLPIINTAIQNLIPPIRSLAKRIKGLSPASKMALVGFVAFLAVIGPVIMLVSQLSFFVAMLGMGFAKMAGVVWSTVMGVASLGGGLLKLIVGIGGTLRAAGGLFGGLKLLLAVIFSVKGAFIGLGLAAAGLILRFTGLGKTISEWFLKLGKAAASWGETFIGTFAGGMLAGAMKFLSKVLTAIGNFIGKYFAGHSPPQLGPLSHIDLWGKNVFDAFLQGMAEADFGILSKIGNTIGNILSSLAQVGKRDEKGQFVMLLEARKNLAKLLSTFNKTGQVSESVIGEIVKDLGEAKDEVANLIRLWVKYVDIQKQLDELEARRNKTIKYYGDEIDAIAMSNRSAAERVNLIRNAMQARDRELRGIAIAEEGLKAEEEQAKKNLDLQQALIDAMQEQDDIQLKLLDTLKAISGALENIEPFTGGGWEPPEPPEPPNFNMEEPLEQFTTLGELIEGATRKWEAFILGLQGGSPKQLEEMFKDVEGIAKAEMPMFLRELMDRGQAEIRLEDFSPTMQGMREAYNQGKSLSGIFSALKTTFETLQTSWTGFTKNFKFDDLLANIEKLIKKIGELIGAGEEVRGGGKSKTSRGGSKPQESETPSFGSGFAKGFTESIADFTEGFSSLEHILAPIIAEWNKAMATIKSTLDTINISVGGFGISWETVGTQVGKVLAFIITLIWAVPVFLLRAAAIIISVGLKIWNVLLSLGNAWAGITVAVMGVGKAISDWATGVDRDIENWVATTRDAIIDWATDALKPITDWVDDAKEAISGWAADTWETYLGWANDVANKINEFDRNAQEVFNRVWEKIKTFFADGKTKVISSVTSMQTTLIGIFGNLYTSITTKVGEIVGKFKTKFDEIKNKVTGTSLWQAGQDLIQGLWNGVSDKVTKFLTWLEGKYKKVLDLWDKITGSNSPAKEMIIRGQQLIEGAVIGVDNKMPDLESSMGMVAATGLSAFAPSYEATPSSYDNSQAVNLTLNFGKDSVRSDDDIKRIAAEVERVITTRSRAYISMGTGSVRR